MLLPTFSAAGSGGASFDPGSDLHVLIATSSLREATYAHNSTIPPVCGILGSVDGHVGRSRMIELCTRPDRYTQNNFVVIQNAADEAFRPRKRVAQKHAQPLAHRFQL